MSTQRRRHSAACKARIALKVLKGHYTVNELASRYGVHPSQIGKWKQHLQSELPRLFAADRHRDDREHEALQAQFYQQIGQLKVELDWLKKKLETSREAKRALIEPDHPPLSIARQCELLGLPRASYSYQAKEERAENLHLMRLVNEQDTRTPFDGIRRMTAWLRTQGYRGNPKRVARRLCLPGGGDGLVQSLRACLGAVDHAGGGLLSRGPGRSTGEGQARGVEQ